MEDIRSVLSQFHSKKKNGLDDLNNSSTGPAAPPSSSEIPDLFFDSILQQFKLNRHEISLLMILYRQVWCRPNLYKSHGIGPLNSYTELSSLLGIMPDDLVTYLRTLEKFGLIETIRSGQYFVRKYFIESFDRQYGMSYDEFF